MSGFGIFQSFRQPVPIKIYNEEIHKKMFKVNIFLKMLLYTLKNDNFNSISTIICEKLFSIHSQCSNIQHFKKRLSNYVHTQLV